MSIKDETSILKAVFDAMPSFVFVVDEDVRIQEYNAAASSLFNTDKNTIIQKRAGDVLHCITSLSVNEGCGKAESCKNCIIRNAVKEAFQGKNVTRRRAKMEIIQCNSKIKIYALITASPFLFKDKHLALLVIEDISEITELYSIISICSVCRKIRENDESWIKVESYFKDNWDLDFSHGLCPECYNLEINKIDTHFQSKADKSNKK